MKQLGPELDQLMWAVAESKDRRAIEDFEARFPQHVLELGKRMAMVRDLRGARSTNLPRTAPLFVPPIKRSAPRALRFGWALGAIAMAAIGTAAFYATQRYLAGPTPTPAPNEVRYVAPEPETVVPENGQSAAGSPQGTVPQAPTGLADVPPPKYELPQTVARAEIELADAIRLIAEQCGMQVDVGPGLPDIKVGFDYQGITGLAMLQDMGPRYGFTAFDEGEGRVLIIPALDRQAPTSADERPGGPGKQPPIEKAPPGGHSEGE